MKSASPKARISLGLCGIIISVIMVASYLEIIPDRQGAIRQSRSLLAETIAIYCSTLISQASSNRLLEDFDLLVERNDDLESIGLQKANGTYQTYTGSHNTLWDSMEGKYSRGSQIRVPIWQGEAQWGQLEIRFFSQNNGVWQFLNQPIVKINLFIGICCFAIFYFYLGRVLRYLDPSQAIPARVRTALDTMAEGLLIVDRKEQIVLANKAFADIYKVSPTKLLGANTSEFPWLNKQGESVEKENRPWVKALAEGAIQKDTILKLDLPGSPTKTFKVNSSPVLGDGNIYAGVLISFDDVTRLEKTEIALRHSKEKAEEANLAKSAFLANMSHEIRTPMNAILGFTDLLKRGYIKNEEESLKYLNTIHSSGRSLLELINDILDLSKVESGRLEIENIATQPYIIIQEVIQLLQSKAQEKNIGLHFEALTDLPEIIKTDPVRLRQISFNLIGNAIKFTESGGVRVSCQFKKNGPQSQLLIDVIDSGIGMEEVALANIFDPFVQADTSVTRRFGGTGLGLSISQKFAKALGGDISVTSKPNQGSTFRIILPTGDLKGVLFLSPESVTLSSDDIESRDEDTWQFKKSRVLVVDDGKENRELVKVLLVDAGLIVDEAENGLVALEKAEANHYDLILMDVQMPKMDGFTATNRLRESGLTTPIIALTANAMKGFEQECIKIGYSGYFTKPIDISPFMKMIAGYLGENEVENTNDSMSEASSNEEESSISSRRFDIARSVFSSHKPVISSLAEHPVLKNVVVEFAEKLKGEYEKMVDCWQRGDIERLGQLAHWLKGAAGTVGYNDFTEPAAILEKNVKTGLREEVERSLAIIEGLVCAMVLPSVEGGERTSLVKREVNKDEICKKKQPLLSQKPVVSTLAEHPKLKTAVGDFVEKLDIEMAKLDILIQSKDLSGVAIVAHWLKGSAGTVGYHDFTEPAAKLEQSARSGELVQVEKHCKHIQRLVSALVSPK